MLVFFVILTVMGWAWTYLVLVAMYDASVALRRKDERNA
jgi:hypothetical protein